jgi:acetyl-CoA decarbonylase/synthase complex subunit gamma
MLLPYIPSVYFSFKGFFSGIVMFLLLLFFSQTGDNFQEQISWFFIITAISSYTAMNYTGSSTFTSLSGVKKEMKLFIPFQIGFASIGLILLIAGKLIRS